MFTASDIHDNLFFLAALYSILPHKEMRFIMYAGMKASTCVLNAFTLHAHTHTAYTQTHTFHILKFNVRVFIFYGMDDMHIT